MRDEAPRGEVVSQSSEAALKSARARIDRIDADLQQLIAQRAEIAREVRDIKAASGADGDHYRPAREVEVLRNAIGRNQQLGSPLPDTVMARLMREIMSACLALETPISVAYLGPAGTFTQAAVYKHFGHSVEARPQVTTDDIFREVEAGGTAYGVVPVENSTEGVISHTLDRLAQTTLSICGEVWLPIHHQLLSNCTDLQSISVIFSHAQSFAQCRSWIDTHLPNALREVVSSNGLAAQMAAEKSTEKTGYAAIASEAAGSLYRLATLAHNIEDDPGNTTRFLVIGRKNPGPTGADKTSLVLELQRDRPGALYQLLEPLSNAGINMLRIESRPSRRSLWDYNFFIDVEGHQEDHVLCEVLGAVESRASSFRILGSYPKAVL